MESLLQSIEIYHPFLNIQDIGEKLFFEPDSLFDLSTQSQVDTHFLLRPKSFESIFDTSYPHKDHRPCIGQTHRHPLAKIMAPHHQNQIQMVHPEKVES